MGTLRSAARWISTLGNGAAFFVLVPSLLAFLGESWWRFHLWEHLRPLYLWGLLLAAIAAAVARRWPWAVLWGVAAAGNAVLLLPYLPWMARIGPGTGPPLRILHANLHVANPEPERFLDWLEQQERDLVLVQELTPEWLRRLEQIERYQVALADPRPNPAGIALLLPKEPRGAWALRSSEILQMSGVWGDRPVVELILHFGEQEIALLSFHAARPISGGESAVQRKDFEWASQWARTQSAAGRQHLIVGDFNSTPWSSRFRRLQRETGLRNSLGGRGLQGSWPTSLPGWMRLPIDHALVSPGLGVAQRELGPELASDHRPLLLEVAPAPPAPD